MASHPLVPEFTGAAVPMGQVLDRQVELLRAAHERGDPVAAEVLRGTGTMAGTVEEILGAQLTLQTARLAIARDHRFGDWAGAREHADVVVDTRFEAAADAIQWGELAELRGLLDAHPALISMRSPFPHRATLLHHVAANGIEVERQLQSPPNAAEIMRLLLERGAEPDAICPIYDERDTTMGLLVSSCVPAAAGVQATLVEELCRGGARVDGLDDDGLPLWTAITFGYTEAAEALVRCGARVDNLIFHAALGNLPAVRVYFGAGGVLDPVRARGSLRVDAVEPGAPLLEYALIEAAAHGRREVVEFLLGQGPDLSVTEPVFGATARGAARHLGYPEIAALL